MRLVNVENDEDKNCTVLTYALTIDLKWSDILTAGSVVSNMLNNAKGVTGGIGNIFIVRCGESEDITDKAFKKRLFIEFVDEAKEEGTAIVVYGRNPMLNNALIRYFITTGHMMIEVYDESLKRTLAENVRILDKDADFIEIMTHVNLERKRSAEGK